MQLLFDILAREVFPRLITNPTRARVWMELIVVRCPVCGRQMPA